MPPPGDDARGLRSWQSLQASESQLPSSQPDPATASFVQRLEKEPQLRFVLTGDGPCVITPVKPPPHREAVAAWLEDKLVSIRSSKKRAARVESVEQGGDGGSPDDAETSLPLDIDVPVEESEGASAREISDDEDSMFTRLKDRHREVRLFFYQW